MRKFQKIVISFIMLLFLIIPVSTVVGNQNTESKQVIYDFAELLTADEKQELEAIAKKYADKREIDYILLTTNDTENKDIIPYMQDFYDEKGLGYDKPHGNTAILTIDMQHRDFYLAGFGNGKVYLDDQRLDLIRDKIQPDLTNKRYSDAFLTFIETADEYFDIKPGVNPNNIIFKFWFQLLMAVGIAGIVVGVMVFNTGGKVTVNQRTYLDDHHSRVLKRKDTYVRTSVTKQPKPTDNNSSGGGGGGVTSGGSSHSGSRGSF